MTTVAVHRAGLVAIVGRPNVGKSTLLNSVVGAKISITSKKAQTTRHRITGIVTRPHEQIVFVDTPGFQTRHANALNRAMNRAVTDSLVDVDLVLFVIEAGRFDERDQAVLRLIPAGHPVLLVINKIDQLADKRVLLPFIDQVARANPFVAILPVSAERGTQLEHLVDAVARHLPAAPPLFAADEITDRSERFLAAELIREKAFRLLGEEVPYGVGVMIDSFEEQGRLRRIHATIIVDRAGHKAILIGAGGQKLKAIATQARREMEQLFDARVFLEVWVKVKGGWADDERQLGPMGYA
ncbi:MAG: GTPase Era [Burkholderiales bacterium]|jgi:GTP-binding protein Era|nr:GTPase Era [Burkholderiales bacterium]